jgi:hypothetical protein
MTYMQDEIKMNCYLKLAEIRWGQFNKRRDFEWKVNFGLWAALGFIIGLGLKGDYTSPPINVVGQGAFILMHSLILIAYLIYIHGLNFANQNDRRAAFECQDRAESFAGTLDNELIAKVAGIIKVPKVLKKWYLAANYGFTLLLIIMSLIVNLR